MGETLANILFREPVLSLLRVRDKMYQEEHWPQTTLQEAARAARLWTGTGVLVERRDGRLGDVHRGQVERLLSEVPAPRGAACWGLHL